jgi:hypothetical protein
MRVRGETWSFFIGYDDECDDYSFQLNWGGMAAERGINGLFPWKHSLMFAVRWPWRHLRRGIFMRPRCYWRAH